MKVLHILNELRFSGMEMMMDNSFDEWKRHEVEIDILATGIEKGEAYSLLSAKGYSLAHISFIGQRMKAFLELRRYLKEKQFDVIHIHTEANFLIHLLNAYLAGSRNIIRTFHSIFYPSFLGKMRRLVDRIIASFFNVRYISVGDSVAKNESIKFFTKSKIIYNWFDTNRFKEFDRKTKKEIRKKLSLSKDTFVITSIGNCSKIKRHELIIEALAKLPKSMDWVYLHAGRENKNCNERKLAKELGVYNRCMFMGLISNAEEVLVISDAYIMSSVIEGLGISAIESMASGVPTLLTKVPGLNDLLRLVPEAIGYDANSDELSAKIVEVYEIEAKEKEELSKALIKKSNELFSISSGVQNYVNFYKDLVI